MNQLPVQETYIIKKVTHAGRDTNVKAAADRIGAIDGWRAIAAIGVLYTHTWALLKFPQFNLGGIDLMKVLNLWGNGVHLFFVISGFCFFLVMRRMNSIEPKTSLHFWKKRWLRIAPAFYVSCLAYLLLGVVTNTIRGDFWDLMYKLVANLGFVQNHVPGAEINAIFWSLAVEWHFYLLLPFLFYFIHKKGFLRTITGVALFGIIINLLHYKGMLFPGDKWWYTIFANINHFVWGIVLGYFFFEKVALPKFFRSGFGLLLGLAIAYIGKSMFSTPVVEKLHEFGFIFQSFGPITMTFGFAVLLYNTLTYNRMSALMGSRVLAATGKISFSFYLWHTLALVGVYSLFGHYIPPTAAGVFTLLALVMVVLIPFSFLSYTLLELPYFKKREK